MIPPTGDVVPREIRGPGDRVLMNQQPVGTFSPAAVAPSPHPMPSAGRDGGHLSTGATP